MVMGEIWGELSWLAVRSDAPSGTDTTHFLCDRGVKDLLHFLGQSVGHHLAYMQAEAQRLVSQHQSDSIFELSLTPMAFVDFKEDRLIRWNNGLASLLGYSELLAHDPDACIKFSHFVLHGDRAAAQQSFTRVASPDNPIRQFRCQMTTAHGAILLMEWSVCVEMGQSVCVCAGRYCFPRFFFGEADADHLLFPVSRDITEEEQRQRKMEEASQAKVGLCSG